MKLESIYKNPEFKDHGPAVKFLFETEFTKEIRIMMRKGQVMKDHKTSFPIVVNVLEGEIDFGVEGKMMPLEKGALIALDADVIHSLTAKKESTVRLTLTKSDDVNRVGSL